MCLGGDDEHAALLDLGLAVRVALVIDEARVVAAHARIDHGLLVDDEQERVVVVLVMVLVALVRLRVGDAIAEVLVERLALLDVARGEGAVAVHVRARDLVQRMSLGLRGLAARVVACALVTRP